MGRISKNRVVGLIKNAELKEDLFNIKLGGTKIWEKIRYKVANKIMEKGGRKKNVENTNVILKYLNALHYSVSSLFYANPFYTDQSDYLFIGHPRRKKMYDGYWWDIYTDPLHEKLNYNYVHYEKPYNSIHKKPLKNGNVKYLDVVEYISKLGESFAQIKRIKCPKPIIKVKSIFKDELGIEIDIKKILKKEIVKRSITLSLYKKILKRVNPNLLFLTTSYANEYIVESCNNMGVKTVELQHGTIGKGHLGYSYEGAREKENFPDYFFSFGKFWTDRVNLPIQNNKIITVGYPFLSMKKKSLEDCSKVIDFLFISQPTIGEELSRFAANVDQNNTNKNIVYKLHPREVGNWKSLYPKLAKSNVNVQGKNSDLYGLFAKSKAQVGVYSTALYEGVYFGLNTYIYRVDGFEDVEPLVESGLAQYVNDVNELAGDSNKKRKNIRKYLFRENPLENFKTAVDSIE